MPTWDVTNGHRARPRRQARVHHVGVGERADAAVQRGALRGHHAPAGPGRAARALMAHSISVPPS